MCVCCIYMRDVHIDLNKLTHSILSFNLISSDFFILLKKGKRKKGVMVDLQTVCCMCGDVGFPDKLFRCSKCRNRFQHSYCSNYYSEYAAEVAEVCDWCQCEERSPSSSSPSTRNNKHANGVRSPYSGEKIKRQHRDGAAEKPAGKTASPRPPNRRYKLLKDVMC